MLDVFPVTAAYVAVAAAAASVVADAAVIHDFLLESGHALATSLKCCFIVLPLLLRLLRWQHRQLHQQHRGSAKG